MRAAEHLLRLAVADLPTPAAASSSSKLTGMLRQQLEQSGFLQQLPQLFQHVIMLIDAAPATAATTMEDLVGPDISVLGPKLSKILHCLVQLDPSFLTTHAGGQQCLLLAMQLQQRSLSYISAALATTEMKPWMLVWAGSMGVGSKTSAAWHGAVVSLIKSTTGGSNSSSSSGAASSSSAGSSSRTLAKRSQAPGGGGISDSDPPSQSSPRATVLSAEATTQFMCMSALVPMLVPFVQQASRNSGTQPAGISSGTGGTAAARGSGTNAADGNSNRSTSRTSSSSTPSGSSGAPRSAVEPTVVDVAASLAPSLPAAYASMLDKLGCSAEVALLLAQLLVDKIPSAERLQWAYDLAVQQLGQVDNLFQVYVRGLGGDSMPMAALQLSMEAAILQWLLDVPGDMLSSKALGCEQASRVLESALVFGCECLSQAVQALTQQSWQQLQQQQQQQPQLDEAELLDVVSARNIEFAQQVGHVISHHASVVPTCASVLQKLLSNITSSNTITSTSPSANTSTSADTSAIISNNASVNTSTTAGANSSNSTTSSTTPCSAHAVLRAHCSGSLSQACIRVGRVLSRELCTAQTAFTGNYIAHPAVRMDCAPTVVSEERPGVAACARMLQQCIRFAATLTGPLGCDPPSSQLALSVLEVYNMLFDADYVDEKGANSMHGQVLVDPIVAAGAVDSPDALQLFGLLCCMLKLSCRTDLMVTADGKRGIAAVTASTNAILSVVLQPYLQQQQANSASLQSASQPTASGSVNPGNSAAASPGPSSSEPSAASSASQSAATIEPLLPSPESIQHSTISPAAVRPWLVLLGRCMLSSAACLAASGELQHQHVHPQPDATESITGSDQAASTGAGSVPTTQSGLLARADPGAEAAAAEGGQTSTPAAAAAGLFTQSVQRAISDQVQGARQWLLASADLSDPHSTETRQLIPPGYDTDALMQHCNTAICLLPALTGILTEQSQAADAPPDAAPPASTSGSSCAALRVSHNTALTSMQQHLQVLGTALTSFAFPHACNNSACSSMSGPSEAQLVGGRSCVCAGCLTARYCGRACQRANWRQHKPVCKALAAAAAAAAVVTGSGATVSAE